MASTRAGHETALELRSSRCTWRGGAFDLLARRAPVGWTGMGFEFAVDGRLHDSRALPWQALPSAPDRLVLYARPADSPVELTVTLEAEPERDLVRLRCRYRNRGRSLVRLARLAEARGRVLCPAGRAFHVENIKQMFLSVLTQPPADGRRVDWGTVLCGVRYWADLGPPLQYGRSEDQPYPALFLFSPAHGLGLLDAPLTQDRWYREVSVAADGAGEGFAYAGAMTTRGVEAVRLPPGAALDGETTLLQIVPHGDLTRVFDAYHEDLQRRYVFRALASPHRDELVWGSWNFGIWSACTDDLVVGNARVIREHFPRVKWVQIDEGWAAVDGGAMGCPRREGANRTKFPRGLAAVAADVKALGLRPALWCGMSIADKTEVVRAQPDWLLRNTDGTPHVAGRCILDYSREDVREFVVDTYRTVIRDWGYEGIKLDFWTYGFEDNGIRYAGDERTSLEWRNWWLATLRGLLPEDGYLQSGCNVCSLSPFVARFFDNIRYGVDVGIGDNWQAVLDSAAWLAPFALVPPGRLWLPNSDAIGSMKAMDAAKKRTWLTFCGVTGSALELGGDLRKEQPADWTDAQRILNGVTIGAPFRAVDFGRPTDPVPPAIWFSPGGLAAPGEPRPAGLLCAFNWSGEGPGRARVTLSELGLPPGRYRAVNYWTGEEAVCAEAVPLPPVPRHDVYAVRLYSAAETRAIR